MSDQPPSKDQLATYLEHCANLADKPLDGVAYVSVGKLREVVQLLRATGEPPAVQLADCGCVMVPVSGGGFAAHHTYCRSISDRNRDLEAENARLRAAQPPVPDQCVTCHQPLPPVSRWSMPSCPECVEMAEDAAKWRALRNCARITAIGSAGCDPRGNSYSGPTAHVTLNFWTHNATESEPWHREWLDTFVAKARAVQTKGSAPDWRNQLGQYEASPTGDDDK